MSFHYKYPINYAPGQAGDTTAFAVKQLIKERNYMYQILNNIIAGTSEFIKAGVMVATTENIPLAGEKTIDGIQVEDGDRVLVWKQTNAKENGVYVVSKGAWIRAEDANDNGDFARGYFTGVAKGTYAGQLFAVAGDVEIGEKPLHFRNIIQGDFVTQETRRARDEAMTARDKAKEAEATADEHAKASLKVKDEVIAEREKAEQARADAEKSKEVVSEKEAFITGKAKEINNAADDVKRRQDDVNAGVHRIADRQKKLDDDARIFDDKRKATDRLLSAAQNAQRETENHVKESRALNQDTKDFAQEARESARLARNSERNSGDLKASIQNVLNDVSQAEVRIGKQKDEINDIQRRARESEEVAVRTKAKAEELERDIVSNKDIITAARDEARRLQGMAKESEEVAKAEAAKAKDSEVKAEESAKQWLISEDKAKAAQTLADATYEKAKSTKTDIENKGAEISDIYQKAKETENHVESCRNAVDELKTNAENAKNVAVDAKEKSESARNISENQANFVKEKAEIVKQLEETVKQLAESVSINQGLADKSKQESQHFRDEAESFAIAARNGQTTIEQYKADTEKLWNEWKDIKGSYYTKKDIKESYYTKLETDKVHDSMNTLIVDALESCSDLKTNKADKSSLIGLASTEYVDGRIKHVVGTAPEALDTLGEIANVLTTNKDKIGTIINQISTKADKGTVENALMGKADKNEVEKALSTKAELKNVYSKQETDEQAVKVARNELNSQGLSRIRAKIVTNSAGPFTVIESKDGTDVKVRGSVSVGAFKKFKDSINEFKEAIKGTILTKDEKPVIYRYT